MNEASVNLLQSSNKNRRACTSYNPTMDENNNECSQEEIDALVEKHDQLRCSACSTNQQRMSLDIVGELGDR